MSQRAVDEVYAYQRGFLGLVGRSSALFLVNGNHEEAQRYLLDGSPTNPAVLAGHARTRFFPLPVPDGFYTGDLEPVRDVGLLRDYYAWTWGDALFVVIDCYWHSPVQVDAAAGGGGGGGGGRAGAPAKGSARMQEQGGGRRARAATKGAEGGHGRQREWWKISVGDAQYQWLRKTLEQSRARYKFVFAHHVLGTGRGGVEMSHLYEWGGEDREGGPSQFAGRRPSWPLPIHQLMAKTGVTIFFQGHDHLFARQERDGVIYQEVPNPADATYTAFNRDTYQSGDILPNSGHLRITVAHDVAKVDYIRSWLPKDESGGHKGGEIAFSYMVKAPGEGR